MKCCRHVHIPCTSKVHLNMEFQNVSCSNFAKLIIQSKPKNISMWSYPHHVFRSLSMLNKFGVKVECSQTNIPPKLYLMIKSLIHKAQPKRELLGWSPLSPKQPILFTLGWLSSWLKGGIPSRITKAKQ
jgi:hypothetical protein